MHSLNHRNYVDRRSLDGPRVQANGSQVCSFRNVPDFWSRKNCLPDALGTRTSKDLLILEKKGLDIGSGNIVYTAWLTMGDILGIINYDNHPHIYTKRQLL
jgi:hypothetical protein